MSTSLSFPQNVTLSLSIVLSVPDQENLEYLVDDQGKPQIGFIADLHDMLQSQTDLPVVTINGLSLADIRGHFSKFI